MKNQVLKIRSSSNKEWSESLRDEIIIEYLPLVKFLAKQLYRGLPKSLTMDDIVSCGVIGLIDAIEKYDASRNLQFKTYASIRIRGAILDYVRDQDLIPRGLRDEIKQMEKAEKKLEAVLGYYPEEVSLCAALGWNQRELSRVKLAKRLKLSSLEDVSVSEKYDVVSVFCEDPSIKIDLENMRQSLQLAIEKLPERSRMVLQLYYFDELTLEQISKIFKVSESRTCQILKKAHFNLKKILQKNSDVYTEFLQEKID